MEVMGEVLMQCCAKSPIQSILTVAFDLGSIGQTSNPGT